MPAVCQPIGDAVVPLPWWRIRALPPVVERWPVDRLAHCETQCNVPAVSRLAPRWLTPGLLVVVPPRLQLPHGCAARLSPDWPQSLPRWSPWQACGSAGSLSAAPPPGAWAPRWVWQPFFNFSPALPVARPQFVRVSQVSVLRSLPQGTPLTDTDSTPNPHQLDHLPPPRPPRASGGTGGLGGLVRRCAAATGGEPLADCA